MASFAFIDLFSGIGGFHAAMIELGGHCELAAETNLRAAKLYNKTWGLEPSGDVKELCFPKVTVKKHDVLCAGFPCQPFSKSGNQLGFDDHRGGMFWSIMEIARVCKPSVMILENVRNLSGPRHRFAWEAMVASLHEAGYRTSHHPTVFSPHLLPPVLGGRPQVRERVFITATYVGAKRAARESAFLPPLVENRAVQGWDPQQWNLETDLPLQPDHEIDDLESHLLTATEEHWLTVWNDLISDMPAGALPGAPLWADAFRTAVPSVGLPAWKSAILRTNNTFYNQHQNVIDQWMNRHDALAALPPSRRKLEWQAQDTPHDLRQCLLQFRPSGIRAKRPTYVPALVAMNQTSVLGWRGRRLTVREAARLQGFPDHMNFDDQTRSTSYAQLGNAVNVGVVKFIMQEHVRREQADLPNHVVDAVLRSDGTQPHTDLEAA